MLDRLYSRSPTLFQGDNGFHDVFMMGCSFDGQLERAYEDCTDGVG